MAMKRFAKRESRIGEGLSRAVVSAITERVDVVGKDVGGDQKVDGVGTRRLWFCSEQAGRRRSFLEFLNQLTSLQVLL